MVKRTMLSDFKVQRYTKPITCMKLKTDDKVIGVEYTKADNVFISTHNGYGLKYKIDEIPISGLRASGVKSISLKNDVVVSAHVFSDEEILTVVTSKHTAKRVRLSEFEFTSRGRKGVLMVRDVKTNPYYIFATFIVSGREKLAYKTKEEIIEVKVTEFPIADRYSTGSQFTKQTIFDMFKPAELINAEDLNRDEGNSSNGVVEEIGEVEPKMVQEVLIPESEASKPVTIDPIDPKIEEVVEDLDKEPMTKEEYLDSIDEKIMTIDDFLDNLYI